ncbi:MAG: hypothetical protein HN704_04725 [Bacteroidetes bacterium]|nr:hypothetical protein [Bacteroidota bacterium]
MNSISNGTILLSEYTKTTAKRYGGLYDSEIDIDKRYIDNGKLYWENEYFITPLTKGDLRITIYCQKADKLELIENLILEVK